MIPTWTYYSSLKIKTNLKSIAFLNSSSLLSLITDWNRGYNRMNKFLLNLLWEIKRKCHKELLIIRHLQIMFQLRFQKIHLKIQISPELGKSELWTFSGNNQWVQEPLKELNNQKTSHSKTLSIDHRNPLLMNWIKCKNSCKVNNNRFSKLFLFNSK